jgi:Kef-type K+ transport system membrane component KefB/nucleotide-binding universal stress UspA family protein
MPHLEMNALVLLLAQIAAIVATSRILGGMTHWLGQPLVIAEIVAGILLGPSLLGWLWPAAMHALFPVSSLSMLTMFSQVGLILFMFLIGLELDPRLLKGRARASVAISHTSIVVPFVLGAGAAVVLYKTHSSPNVPLLHFVLFMGVALSVTAFPVLARILSERHLLSSRVGAITIACAAVDDITAWCLLAFIVTVTRARAVTDAIWTTVLAAGFVMAMLLLLRPFLKRLGARVASREGLTPTGVALTLLLLLLCSSVTELIGIHALFGAFLFGAIFPKEGGLAEALIEKLETVSVVLLLPVFFAYSGLRTQIGLLNDSSDWLITLVIIALATLGKFGGSAVAARLTGLRWREAGAIGILMNTRGLMELIVLNIGLDLGVISPRVFTMLVIMALVTTFITTPLLRWVYPDKELAQDRLPEPRLVSTTAPPYTALMCVADPRTGPGMVTVVNALLGPSKANSRLFALHLSNPSDRPSAELRELRPEPGAAVLAPLLKRAQDLSVDIRPISFVSAEPAEDICRTAEAKEAAVIFLGWHKPLWAEGRLAGTVSEVLERAESGVAVLVDRGLKQVQRILVPFAGAKEDVHALRLAKRLAQVPGNTLTLLHVAAPNDKGKALREKAQVEEILKEAGPELSVQIRSVEHSSGQEAVLRESKAANYDMLILGMAPQWGMSTHLLSLRRERLLSASPISVLVVRGPTRAMAHAPFAEPKVISPASATSI